MVMPAGTVETLNAEQEPGTQHVGADFRLVLHCGAMMQRLSPHEFYLFCRANPDWQFECTRTGDLIIMAPTGGATGHRNFSLIVQFGRWVEDNASGLGFDSSTIFLLRNGARRSPDVSWVRCDRWEALTPEQREEFPPLCPDFVVELRSRTDRLAVLQAKMQEYLHNGAQLGWLIDPYERKVYIYRPDREAECLDNPGEPDRRSTLARIYLCCPSALGLIVSREHNSACCLPGTCGQ